MDLLTKLEQALEGMVEGVFTRAFKAPLQPVEVAKRLTRALESQRTVSVNATYVPNVYTIGLSPEMYENFQAISSQLLGELEQYVRDFIAEHHYQTVGPVAVMLAQDEELRGNDLQVTTANEVQAVPSVPPPPSVLRSTQPQEATARSAPHYTASLDHTVIIRPTSLEVTAGELQGRRVPLTDGLIIGRSPACALVFTEPDISRQHAKIVWQDSAWVLMDAGSTNGTFVNERRISSHPLHPGDIIKIGTAVILVR